MDQPTPSDFLADCMDSFEKTVAELVALESQLMPHVAPDRARSVLVALDDSGGLHDNPLVSDWRATYARFLDWQKNTQLKQRLHEIDTEIERLEERKRALYRESIEAPEHEKLCSNTIADMLGEPLLFGKATFPMTVEAITFTGRVIDAHRKKNDLVSVRPCGAEFEKRTFLGVHLGDCAQAVTCFFNKDTGVLQVALVDHNPAIWIPTLRRIVYGHESWWRAITSAEDLDEITDEQIQSIGYVKVLRAMLEKDASVKG